MYRSYFQARRIRCGFKGQVSARGIGEISGLDQAHGTVPRSRRRTIGPAPHREGNRRANPDRGSTVTRVEIEEVHRDELSTARLVSLTALANLVDHQMVPGDPPIPPEAVHATLFPGTPLYTSRPRHQGRKQAVIPCQPGK